MVEEYLGKKQTKTWGSNHTDARVAKEAADLMTLSKPRLFRTSLNRAGLRVPRRPLNRHLGGLEPATAEQGTYKSVPGACTRLGFRGPANDPMGAA